jgi:hypothetical protein
MPHQTFRLPGKFSEDLLCNILCPVRVAIDQPEGGGINQVHMPPDQFSKSGFRLFGGVPAQQFSIIAHHVSQANARRRENRTKNCTFPGDRRDEEEEEAV